MTSHRQLHPTQDLDTNAPAISIRGLHKSFGEVKVLEGIDLNVHRGQVVCVIGPSGSGKSTLLRCVNRLEEPTAGRILIEGVDITDPDTELDAVRSRIGMVFQSFNLFSHMSVLRNLTLAQQKVKRRGRKEAVAIAMENLERVGLAHRAEANPSQLSGGQQQRVAIARAMVQQPDIILADEPIASLDPRNTRIVMDALLRINKHFGITVLCNLHSLDLARSYCDRLIGMAQGRVVFDGAPAALTDHVARELYDLEAADVMGGEAAPAPAGVPALGTAAAA